MSISTEEYSYNKQQNQRNNSTVALCKIFFALVLFFWLSTHVDITRALYQGFIAVSNKPLPIFIFMNVIIFALCFLSSQNRFQPPYVVYHDNEGSGCESPHVGNDCLIPEVLEQTEEMSVDKHMIVVESGVGDILAVSFDNSESFESQRLDRGMSKELVITMREPPRRSMDDMSNEEFRFAVEAFISDKKEAMKQENIHEEEGIPLLEFNASLLY